MLLSDMNEKDLIPRTKKKIEKKTINKTKEVRELFRSMKGKQSKRLNGMTREQSCIIRILLCHDQWKLIRPQRIFRKIEQRMRYEKKIQSCLSVNYHKLRENCRDIAPSMLN